MAVNNNIMATSRLSLKGQIDDSIPIGNGCKTLGSSLEERGNLRIPSPVAPTGNKVGCSFQPGHSFESSVGLMTVDRQHRKSIDDKQTLLRNTEPFQCPVMVAPDPRKAL
jgi:hypothetical protein